MAAPPSSSRRAAWIAGAVGLLLLALLITMLTVHTDRCARDFDARVINAQPGLTAPRFFLDNDSYAWLVHARDLMDSGDWRIRHTFMDNTPYGRPMHWSHPILWGLRGMTALFVQWNGWSRARSLDLAGVWIMPLFQFLILSPVFVLLLRKTGWATAALLVLPCLVMEPLFSVFYPIKPDHHGLQVFSSFLAFLCLYLGGMGWVRADPTPVTDPPVRAFMPLRPPSSSEARRWFAAAGLLGAVSLWLGATVWMFAFVITLAAALSVIPAWCAPPTGAGRYQPSLWGIWGLTGAAGSMIFYLLEYAPNHFSMRLEVNHPVYMLTWLGTAGGISFASRASSWRFWHNRSGPEWGWLAASILAALAVPVLILAGPAEWHVLRDPISFQWNDRFVAEFEPGLFFAIRKARDFLWPAFGVLPVAALILLLHRAPRDERIPSGRSLVLFTLLFGLLFLRQLRWLPFFVLPLTGLAALLLNQRLAGAGRRSTLAAVLATALALNIAMAGRSRWQIESNAGQAILPPEAWVRALAVKHTVLRIGLAAGTQAWRMIGTTDDAPCLYYFTGIPSTASFYWENRDGWQAEINFYCDTPDGNAARSIALERGLTRALALPAPDRECLFAMRTAQASPGDGWTPDQPTLADRVAGENTSPRPPDWMTLDKPLSSALSERILLSTPAGYFHLQKPVSFYALSPGHVPESPDN